MDQSVCFHAQFAFFKSSTHSITLMQMSVNFGKFPAKLTTLELNKILIYCMLVSIMCQGGAEDG